MPVIASGGATRFWLYFGNSDAESNTNSAGVWSNEYLAVWHLAEAAEDETTGAVHEDATERGNNGTQNRNHGVGPEASPDIIGGAQVFDGFEDFIEIPQGGLQETGTAVTLLVRAYVDEEPNELSFALGSGGAADAQWRVTWARSVDTWNGRVQAGGNTGIVVADSRGLRVWQLVAVVYDGEEVSLYLDGERVEILTASLSGNLAPLTAPLYIGDNPGENNGELDGAIDEVRIARAARSPSWLRLQHASMSDALLGFGPTECRDGCPP